MAVMLVVGSVTEPSQPVQAAAKKVKITRSLKVKAGKTAKIKLKNNKSKPKWKVVKGKTVVKITKKTKKYAVIKGIKKGNARIQAVIGKKKYTCKITVSAKQNTSNEGSQPAPMAGSEAPPRQTEGIHQFRRQEAR